MADEQNDKVPEKFLSYTSAHGLQFTERGNHPLRRVLWIMAILFTLAMFLRQVCVSIDRLNKLEKTLISRVEFKNSLKFPAVSFCNMNMMKKSKINGTDSQVYLDHLDFIRKKWDQGFSSSSFDIEQAVLQNGHHLEDMLVDCQWNGDFCTAKNFTQFFSFQKGLCYTFNSGQQGHQTLFSQNTNNENGLIIVLNAEVDEYYGIFSYKGTGFTVFIHDQDDYPSMENGGFDLSAGYRMKYAMTKEKFVGLDLPSCTTSDGYSQSACLMECEMNLLKNLCGCRILSTLKNVQFSGLRFCNFVFMKDKICVMKKFQQLSKSQCNCPLPCTRQRYIGHHSLSVYPSPHFWLTLDEIQYKTGRFKNMDVNHKGFYSRLEIFFSSPLQMVIEERFAYTFDDMLSDFGGCLGLFLGCSILTLGEFVDLFIMLCRKRFRKNRVTEIGK